MNREHKLFQEARKFVSTLLDGDRKLDKTYISLVSDLVSLMTRSGIDYAVNTYQTNKGKNHELMRLLVDQWKALYEQESGELFNTHYRPELMMATLRAIKIAMYSFELKKQK